MSNPLVSVIVPVFNGEEFIAESLESILAQDYRPLEILVVDDGSTDDTWTIVSALAATHAELHLQRHHNMGSAGARNTALAAARGEFLTFLDADDRMAAGRVSFQVGYLQTRREVDIVMGSQQVVVEPEVDLPGWLQQPPEKQPRYYPMSMMVRRELFDRVGDFTLQAVPGEDAEWLHRASAANTKIAMVDRLMVYRRIHGRNQTYQARELGQAVLRSLRARIAERRQA